MRATSASSARRAPSTGRTRCGSASTTSSTPPSSSTSSGGTSSRRRPTAGTRRSLEGLYRKDFQILPVVDAILRHPALLTGPRMVKPPAVYTAGLLRALGRGVDTQAWAWLSSESGQRLFMPPNVSGWDDERWLDTATFRGRWEVANYATQPFSLTDKQSAALPAEPQALVDGALAFWGSPTIRPGDKEGTGQLRHEGDVGCRREVEADELPVPRRKRSSPADRRVPRPPDLVRTPMARCCNDFSRTELFRRATAEAGRGLPAIEAGMPLPAGTGLDRRSFLARTAGLTLAVYGGAALLPRAFEEGIAAATAAGPQKVLLSVFLDGGADSLSMLFPNGDPLYRSLRPKLGLPESAGSTVRRGRTAALAPVAHTARHAPRRGQGDGAPGRRLCRPRPVAFHVAPLLGGRRDERPAAHGLARALSRPGRFPGQPASGPLARVPPPTRPCDRPDAGRLDRRARPVPVLDPKRVGRGRAPDARRDRLARRAADRWRRGAHPSDVRCPQGRAAAPAAAAVRTEGRQARLHEPGRVSHRRGRRVPAPARGRRGHARRRPSHSGRGHERARACTTPTTTSRRGCQTA